MLAPRSHFPLSRPYTARRGVPDEKPAGDSYGAPIATGLRCGRPYQAGEAAAPPRSTGRSGNRGRAELRRRGISGRSSCRGSRRGSVDPVSHHVGDVEIVRHHPPHVLFVGVV